RGPRLSWPGYPLIRQRSDVEAVSHVRPSVKSPTFERVKYGKVRHQTQQTPASGDTTSRLSSRVAGIRVLIVAPLDQESPGSSPGGAMGPGTRGGCWVARVPARQGGRVDAAVTPRAFDPSGCGPARPFDGTPR